MSKELLQLSKDLNLDYFPQDWGIINSSDERLEEFITFYHTEHSNTRKYQLFELIIASMNDAIQENNLSTFTEQKFRELIAQYSTDELFSTILEYWRGLSVEEYPVKKYLIE